MKTPVRLPVDLDGEAVAQVLEHSEDASRTARLRRLPSNVTQAQIIREEFRSRTEEVEHVVLFSDARGACARTWFGNHRDSAQVEDLRVRR